MKKNYLFTLVLMFATQMFWAQVTVTTTAAFSTCAGTASAPQIIAVSDGLPTNTNLTVTPPAGFEVKKVGDSNYSASLIISRNITIPALGLGTIPSTQLHIRLRSNATGSPSGNVTFVRGVQTTNMAVSGTVNAVPATPTITASGSTTFCAGGSVTLTAPSSTGYVWSTGETSRSITVTSAGTYSVTVSNASGCSASSTGTVVTVNALPFVDAGATPAPTCLNTPVTLNGSSVFPTIINGFTGVFAPTNWVLENINADGFVDTTAAPTSITLTGGDNESGRNGNTNYTYNTIVAPASGSLSFSWNYSNFDEDGASFDRPNFIINGISTPMTGFSTIGNANQSGTMTIASITKGDIISFNINTRDNILGRGLVTISNFIYTYSNSNPVQWTSNVSGAFVTANNTNSVTVSKAGTYTITATGINGCTNSDTVVVTQLALANTPAITTTGNATVCEGETVVLNCDESASPSSTYTWYKDGQNLNLASSRTISVTESGMYTVVVNNGVCNSLPSPARKVTVNPRPENPTIITSGTTGLCAGASVTLSSPQTTGNLWSTGAITPSITVSTAGTYTLEVTNSFGCKSQYEEEEIVIEQPLEDARTSVNTASVTVTVNTAPLRPIIIAEGPTSFCAGGSVTLTTLSETPITWSNGSTESSITVDRAGTYTAKTDIQGCFSQSSLPKTIVVNALPTKPTITAVGSPNLAPGKSVLLTSSVSSGNTWSTNAKTRSITVKSAGSYSVSVSSTKGCTATSEPFIVTSGSTNTSKVASDNSKKENSNAVIRVYPNPSKGIFNIDSDENGEVSIVNILGQSVKTVKVKAGANNTVNAENLSNGVYFVRNSNTNKSSKLIINK